MNAVLLRPRVGDLIFQLYGRPVHPELFEILAARKLRREDYELSVWITRTGHVISFENRDVFLTEIAASYDQMLPERRRLLHYRLRYEQTGRLLCAHGISYQMSFQVEVLPPELFVTVHDEIRSDGNKRGLLHHFPPAHRFDVSPLGFVTADARRGCLLLSTFHTFPSEYTIVKTQSLIEKV